MAGNIEKAKAAFLNDLAATEQPASVTITQGAFTTDGRATLKITDQHDGFTWESTVTIHADATDGYVMKPWDNDKHPEADETSFVRADDAAQNGAAGLIKSELGTISRAAWFREAVLESAFTRNADLTDVADSFPVLEDPDAAPVDRIHELQDLLVAVSADPGQFNPEEHQRIAIMLVNVDAAFWDTGTDGTDTGAPWAEVYFTYELLEQAQAAYEAHFGKADGVFANYEFSHRVLAQQLEKRQYVPWCAARGTTDDLWDNPKYQCDTHDDEIRMALAPYWTDTHNSERDVLAPPLIDGAPATLTDILAKDLADSLAKSASWAIRDNREAAVETVKAVNDVLRDDDMQRALADLAATLVDVTTFITNDPAFQKSVSGLVDVLVSAAAQGKFVSAEAQKRAQEAFKNLLGKAFGWSAAVMATHESDIRALTETLVSAGLASARSGRVKSAVEQTVIDYLEVGTQLLGNPKVQAFLATAVQKTIAIGTQGLHNVLANPEDLDALKDTVAASLVPLFDALAAGLDEDGKKALATALSHLFAASASAAINASEEPEMKPLMDLFGSEVAPKIEEFLAWQMMTPCEQRKAARTRAKNVAPTLTPSGDMYLKLTYHEDQSSLFSTHETASFDGREVSYHVGADKGAFPFGAIEASMNVSDKNFSVDFARKAFTNYPFHEEFFLKNKILEEAPLLDARGKSKSEGASYATDENGNPASFIDDQGRAHYLIYQHVSVMGTQSEYLLDLWVDKDEFPGNGERGEMVIGWDVVPATPTGLKNWGPVKDGSCNAADIAQFYKKKFTSGWMHPEHNTGAWQIIDANGDGKIDTISWGAAVSGTEAAQKILPKPFAKNVYDMMRIIEEQR